MNTTTTDFWIITLAIGVGTYILRTGFIFLLGKIQISPTLSSILRYIPPAVFASLAIPPLVLHHGALAFVYGKERFLAGIIATIVGLKTKNMIYTLIWGLSTLYLLKWIQKLI